MSIVAFDERSVQAGEGEGERKERGHCSVVLVLEAFDAYTCSGRSCQFRKKNCQMFYFVFDIGT